MEKVRETIIIVDDDKTNLIVAANSLDDKYSIFTASSGERLFQTLEKVSPDLILLDIEMPGMDGYAVISELKKSKNTAHIPVIFLTAKIDPGSEVKGLNLGAVDYITKPFSRELLTKRVELHLLLERQKNELLNYSRNLESEIDKKTKTIFDLQNAILQTVAELVESRDNVTGGHIERTQSFLGQLVDFMLEHGVYAEELRAWDINLFLMSSQLHDVGKISIKDNILMKPEQLIENEFEEIKRHTVFGVEIIEKIEEKTPGTTFLQYAKIMAGTHHEKWDGSGYPYGLKGETIPLMGRLMAIADVYDALTSDRPYKKSFSHEESLEIIRAGRGTHFDPQIVDIFLLHEKEFKKAEPKKKRLRGDYKKEKDVGLQSTLHVLANIMSRRGGKEGGSIERAGRHLEVLIHALLEDSYYKQEVSDWDIDLFLFSAQLHDAGEIIIPDEILNKTSELTEKEYGNVKTHADFGLKIIHKIKENVDNGGLLYHAEALAGSHHERWDGMGYPLGLRGKAIPLQGRIMAIVDAYNALTNDRPYRARVSHKEAVEIIKNGSGTQFDPGLVEVFLTCEEDFKKVKIE
jgi:putative two-component system response regulator